MSSNHRGNIACTALLALLGACSVPVTTYAAAYCGGLDQACGSADAGPCCPGFACDATTLTCLLSDGDGGACQAVYGDCTANPNWCCGGSYCDPLITTCATAVDTSGNACAVQGDDCSAANCCADLACDDDTSLCLNAYQTLDGPCTATVQCGATPSDGGALSPLCDPALLDAGEGDCCIGTGNDCTANPGSCCTGDYCDPVSNLCDVALNPDGSNCAIPPTGTCAQDTDCCPDLVCDSDAGLCTGCATSTQGCGEEVSDGGVDAGVDAGATDGGSVTTDGGTDGGSGTSDGGTDGGVDAG